MNRAFGEPSGQLHERHDASDFDAMAQDKAAAREWRPSGRASSPWSIGRESGSGFAWKMLSFNALQRQTRIRLRV